MSEPTSSQRRAKIVCTIGPAQDSPAAVRALVDAGMDVARLNFSHGAHEEHRERLGWVRAASREAGRPVAVLQDLQGPKIRTGRGGPRRLASGDRVRVVAGDEGREGVIAVDYATLVHDVEAGDRILLGDGVVELSVESAEADALVCRVENGGALRDRMGVNVPSRRVRLDALTDQDREDLAFGLGIGVDYVALSFVRSAGDVERLRRLCEEAGRGVPIVAKLETPEAVEDVEAILGAADALMLARGDLGVELPPERVPVVQKHVIERCRTRRRPVIVATEMLHSMVRSSRPTRAEASDVANAVFDGADALMLSAETATGDHPAHACAMMARIIAAAEGRAASAPPALPSRVESPEAIARAACQVADEIGAALLIVLTTSGRTARLLAAARPRVPVIGLSPNEETLRRMALYWGVRPQPFDVVDDVDELVEKVGAHLRETGLVREGAEVVTVLGTPIGERGSTNTIRVIRVG